MKARWTAALAAAALAGAAGAWAHGDEHNHGHDQGHDHGHGAAHDHGHHHAMPAGQEQKPWGIAGDAARARTVEIAMGDDMRFRPARIEVAQGETVRFVLHNRGAVLHEMVIGTPDELARHAAMMRKNPTMQHDDASMSHVAAGHKGELVWNFNRPGTFQFACLIPGHFEAGMTGTIVVTAPAKKR